MKINGNAIRPGNVIEHKGRLCVAIKTQHTQPGKGGAYLQVELKDLMSGTKMNERFRSSESVERVRLDEKESQFLFSNDDTLTFMDNENYEQFTLPTELVGDGAIYLQDGMTVIISVHEGTPMSVQLPAHVTVAVAETEPVIKGQTAASSYKPALLENGVRTMVPPHINAEARVVIATEDGTYVERAKD